MRHIPLEEVEEITAPTVSGLRRLSRERYLIVGGEDQVILAGDDLRQPQLPLLPTPARTYLIRFT